LGFESLALRKMCLTGGSWVSDAVLQLLSSESRAARNLMSKKRSHVLADLGNAEFVALGIL
jgi:hypothetical protein